MTDYVSPLKYFKSSGPLVSLDLHVTRLLATVDGAHCGCHFVIFKKVHSKSFPCGHFGTTYLTNLPISP